MDDVLTSMQRMPSLGRLWSTLGWEGSEPVTTPPISLSPLPLSRQLLGPATKTLARSTVYALLRKQLARAVFVVLLAAGVVAGLLIAPWLVVLPVVAAGVAVAAVWPVKYWLLRRALGSDDWEAWTVEDASVVLVVRRHEANTWTVANLGAFPRGGMRTTPFLRELCSQADAEGRVLRASAWNRRLYERLYKPLGFTAGRSRFGWFRIERYPTLN